MKYTSKNLPQHFLVPPIPAPHPHTKETWDRNWTLYQIDQHWNDQQYGKLIVFANWLSAITGEPPLKRQRIHQIIRQTHWMLRDYPVTAVGTME